MYVSMFSCPPGDFKDKFFSAGNKDAIDLGLFFCIHFILNSLSVKIAFN